MGAKWLPVTLAAVLLAVSLTVPRLLEATELPASKEPSAANAPAATLSATFVDSSEARGILGRAVKDATGANMGHIVDVVVDPSGQLLAAVIDFGGFLGVGSRKIAVEWSALKFGRAVKDGGDVHLELTRDQLKAAPEYKDGKPLVVIGAVGNLKPLSIPAPTRPEK